MAKRYGRVMRSSLVIAAEVEQHSGLEARVVARAIGTALTARRPRTRYMVGRDAKVRAAMTEVLADSVLDRLIVARPKA
jgi:hypothetical protein